MNRAQAQYALGRVFNEYPDCMYAATAAFFAVNASTTWMKAQEHPIHYTFFAINTIWGSACVALTARELLNRKDLMRRTRHPQKTPVEIVIIQDELGLDRILQRTADKEELEFGTMLRRVRDGSNITITEILDPAVAEQKKLILERGKRYVRIEKPKLLSRLGYGGMHHYHPQVPFTGHAYHYAINNTDRNKPKNWIDLLTFNTPAGPELIGYDNKRTYLPTDATKRTLVRATPKDIWKYLADKPSV